MSQKIVARFQFHPDQAEYFIEGGAQFIEMQFDEVDEIIEYCEEFEGAIIDCTANVNGRIISLAEQPAE